MKIICLLLSLFLLSNNYAADKKPGCQYVKGSAQVGWTAFKTKKKIPVRGVLKKVKINPSSGKTVQEIVNGAGFEVSGQKGSVDSKNAARDAKIARFFFGSLKGGPVIKGRVATMTEKQIVAHITFNGRTKAITMGYAVRNGTLRAKGNLDFVSQFGAKKSHTELGKACAAKHEGKTGTDARIELTAKFTGC